jgi:predicted Zn-dependent protease
MLFVLLGISLAGCATTGGVGSFTSAADTEKLHNKEQRLWHEAAQFDNSIARSGQVYNDKRATAYLQAVMDRLFPEFKGKIQVQIYDSTQLNAFALPNGSIYFNLGLLARIDNESQLAAVLGHEAEHFVEKHSFKERVRAKNAAAFAVSGIPFADLAAVSSITGFSKDLEREADAKGYKRLVSAGYDPREAHKVFQYLADEVKALGIKEPYFFSTHPRLVERIDEFKSLSARHKGGGHVGAEAFNNAIRPLRLEALRKDLGQDRHQSIILVLEDKHKRSYYPPAAHYFLGEAYSRRNKEGDAQKAMTAYNDAMKLAPEFAPTYKALGMHYMKNGKKQLARQHFQRYLTLAPANDRDRSYVEHYLKSL